MTMMMHPEFERHQEPHRQLVFSATTRSNLPAQQVHGLTESAFVASAASVAIALALAGRIDLRDSVHGGSQTIRLMQSRYVHVRSLRYQNPFELAQALTPEVVNTATIISAAATLATAITSLVGFGRRRKTRKRDNERLERIAENVDDLTKTFRARPARPTRADDTARVHVDGAWDSLTLDIDDADYPAQQKVVAQTMISGFKASRRTGSAFVVLERWNVEASTRADE